MAISADQRTMLVPQGEFELERYPRDARLRAWDAADEYLLHHVAELRSLTRDGRVLIVNDAFGALAVALATQRVYSWNDSWLAQQALRNNLGLNGYDEAQVRVNQDIGFPAVPSDCILIKIPKTLSLLEHQLYAIRPLMHRDSYLLAAGMARHIHSSTLELFEHILGPTTTTRARKKSRLIHVQRDHSLNQGQSHAPECYTLTLDRDYRVFSHAGLFSRDRLDRGTRLLLEHLPRGNGHHRVVDLGCGNGVLGLVAASINPAANLLFSDESYLAVASARQNFEAAFGASREAEFRVGDALQGVEPASRDLVLINPPFHQQHSRGDNIAWQMFRDARRVLVDGGELRVVGNRHLGYHAKLKKLFGNCSLLASDSKFVVLQSTRLAD